MKEEIDIMVKQLDIELEAVIYHIWRARKLLKSLNKFIGNPIEEEKRIREQLVVVSNEECACEL